MKPHRSSRHKKGKDVDRSTEWTDYQWHTENRYWWRSRLDSSGETIYDVLKSNPATTQQQQSTPRTPGELSGNDTLVPSAVPASGNLFSYPESGGVSDAAGQSKASDDVVHQDPNYKHEPAADDLEQNKYSAKDTLSDSNTNFQGFRQVTSTETHGNLAANEGIPSSFQYPTPSYQQFQGSAEDIPEDLSGSHSSPSFYSSYPAASGSSVQPPQVENLSYGLGRMGIGTVPEEGYQPSTAAARRHIRKEPNSKSYEDFDPRYCVVEEHEQANFWKVGRVFMMLWTEPANSKVPRGGGTRNGSHFSTVIYGESAYSEIRRFVVMKVGWGNNICCPIQTYNNQGTLKPNLPEPQRHTIIYTGHHVPDPLSYRAEDGTKVVERLTKDPIRVQSERSRDDQDGQLEIASRLNYSKVYTVENYVRVLNVGMVHPKSMGSLLANSPFNDNTGPVGPPIKRPPRADAAKGNSHRRDKERDKDRNRNRDKDRERDQRKDSHSRRH